MKRPPLPNAVFHRASVRCVCGRPLFDLLDHPQATDGAGPASRVQVDCPQCQYLVFLLLRWRGLPRQKRAVLVVHTVDLRAGKVVLHWCAPAGAPFPSLGECVFPGQFAGWLQLSVGDACEGDCEPVVIPYWTPSP